MLFFILSPPERKVNFIRDIMLSEYYFYASVGEGFYQFVCKESTKEGGGVGSWLKGKANDENNEVEQKLKKITFHE